VRLEVTAKGATLEYDCARGTIDSPVVLNGRGRFTAKGTHRTERGGPTRVDAAPSSAVRYSGAVKGDTMTLTVTLETGNERVGVFTLTRGREPLLMKCR
jgi:hypothetical protein